MYGGDHLFFIYLIIFIFSFSNTGLNENGFNCLKIHVIKVIL